ncbi:hypothetical protein AMS68_006388 [Peltaster fructicola]|uniref:Bacteriophage T5 Orf172 DNA-binding domain-containing protein n=1 Tax=Peltaster fructicola TaxID=286661 RepID=A0A6H0Y1S6_9PEZI|nr:hypothetical protein AMS68_006388 [Peltaster fructicola]
MYPFSKTQTAWTAQYHQHGSQMPSIAPSTRLPGFMDVMKQLIRTPTAELDKLPSDYHHCFSISCGTRCNVLLGHMLLNIAKIECHEIDNKLRSGQACFKENQNLADSLLCPEHVNERRTTSLLQVWESERQQNASLNTACRSFLWAVHESTPLLQQQTALPFNDSMLIEDVDLSQSLADVAMQQDIDLAGSDAADAQFTLLNNSDLACLVEMGFAHNAASGALRRCRTIESAISWLVVNQPPTPRLTTPSVCAGTTETGNEQMEVDSPEVTDDTVSFCEPEQVLDTDSSDEEVVLTDSEISALAGPSGQHCSRRFSPRSGAVYSNEYVQQSLVPQVMDWFKPYDKGYIYMFPLLQDSSMVKIGYTKSRPKKRKAQLESTARVKFSEADSYFRVMPAERLKDLEAHIHHHLANFQQNLCVKPTCTRDVHRDCPGSQHEWFKIDHKLAKQTIEFWRQVLYHEPMSRADQDVRIRDIMRPRKYTSTTPSQQELETVHFETLKAWKDYYEPHITFQDLDF